MLGAPVDRPDRVQGRARTPVQLDRRLLPAQGAAVDTRLRRRTAPRGPRPEPMPIDTDTSASDAEVGAYQAPVFPLPVEPGHDALVPELRDGDGRQLAARVVAVIAFTCGLVYLAWRLTSTFDGAELALSIPLLAVEVSSVLGFVGLPTSRGRCVRAGGRHCGGRHPSTST